MIELRARLMKEFEDELEEGLLSILIVDDVSDIRTSMIKMIVVLDRLVVFFGLELWSQPGALQCQIRRLIEDSSHNVLDGSPALWSQKYCLQNKACDILLEWFNFCLHCLRLNSFFQLLVVLFCNQYLIKHGCCCRILYFLICSACA